MPPARGGHLVGSTRTEPRSFNRLASRGFDATIFALVTQDRLVRVNQITGGLDPWVAESWISSPDGLTHTLTLRESVMWSDGTPLTSADVLFSFQVVYDPRAESIFNTSMSINGKPLQVTAPDARTVVVKFPEPFGPGIRMLDNLTLAPKHKLEGALKSGTFPKAWSSATPPSEFVSLGPFVLTRYEPGQRIVYDRNPRYWRKDARGVQLPYLDQLIFEIVPDQDTELVRLQSGQIDFMQQQLRASDVATLKPLEAQGRVRLMELGVGPEVDSFVFNLRPAKWRADPRGAWMPRREFRQAISHAVDREAFANSVFLGAAVPVNGPITPGNKRWFSPNVPRYEFSREKARALLSGLGLRNRDQDEWLEDEKGTEARFSVILFRGNSVLERSAAVVRDDLSQVGVAMDIVPLEPIATQQRVVAGDFDTAFLNFGATDLDPAMSKDFWLSSGDAHFWNPGQPKPGTDWERQIDELMTKQAASQDEAERTRLFNEVQRIFAENLPILYFAAPRIYMGVSQKVGHVTPALVRPQLLWSADSLSARPQ